MHFPGIWGPVKQFYFIIRNRGRQAVQVERRKRKFKFEIPEPQEVQLVGRGERGGSEGQPEKEFRINQQIQVNTFDIDDVIDLLLKWAMIWKG
jgi:hypothetical protein